MLFDDNIGFVSYDLFNSMMNSKVNNNKLVSVDEGFLRGNLFKDEYKPYKNYEYGKIVPKNQREALLLEIMELSFAINDLNLYLDLHPNDEEMLRKFNSLVEKSCQKEMEFIKNYGTLEVIDNDSKQKFEWINSPWPWEREDNKYV